MKKWSENLKAQYNMQLLTAKEKLKSKLLAFPDVFSSFASGMRQSIEVFPLAKRCY